MKAKLNSEICEETITNLFGSQNYFYHNLIKWINITGLAELESVVIDGDFLPQSIFKELEEVYDEIFLESFFFRVDVFISCKWSETIISYQRVPKCVGIVIEFDYI